MVTASAKSPVASTDCWWTIAAAMHGVASRRTPVSRFARVDQRRAATVFLVVEGSRADDMWIVHIVRVALPERPQRWGAERIGNLQLTEIGNRGNQTLDGNRLVDSDASC